MGLGSHPCPCCARKEIRLHSRYQAQAYGARSISHWLECAIDFSETFATPMAGLTTPRSRMITILTARPEGMSLHATARTPNVSKNSSIEWERCFAGLKPTLLRDALLPQCIHQASAGDELYTKVEPHQPPSDSQGWTIVLMARGRRCLWERHGGRKDQQLLQQAGDGFVQVSEPTDRLSLFTAGERR